jgi:predicted dehydrogenase
MIKIGIIGYGYWGPNLVRNFNRAHNAELRYVADLQPELLNEVANLYPSIKVTTKIDEILKDEEIEAVVIATPVSSHFSLAKDALESGKHVLVEKPLASNSDECEILVSLASSLGKVLMVDHTFPYNPAVRKMKELVSSGVLGDLYYFDSTRVNLGLFQNDINVIWDLAVHDLSILDYLVKEQPIAVSATGMSHVNSKNENIAFLTLFFDSHFIAHININWLSPVKLRQTILGGDKKMVLYDDLEPTEKIKVYDKGIILGDPTEKRKELNINYRTGDLWIPNLERTEALQNMVQEFIQSIVNGRKPLTDGSNGYQVVKIMEAATKSMHQQGQKINIKNI